jgi:tetratricopeptide (TPR) repeat protein
MKRKPLSRANVFHFFILYVLCIFFLMQSAVISQETKDRDWYYEEAEKAISQEHYEYAVKLLQEAKKLFTHTSIFHIQLGDLYFDKKFYELALKEYIGADIIDPDEYDTLDQIQRCYGYLNQEQKSIGYLERMLELFPIEDSSSSVDTVDDLGWMYFKTHQLEKGEKLMLETLKKRSAYDINRGLTMTLGTIYSGIYDYEQSKKYYLEAIEEAEDDGDYQFASVAYYNLSLLEHSFYNFNSALHYTNESILSQDRATGHLSKGELFQSQMNFGEALSEYEAGIAKDDTPLTKINVAILYRIFGDLDTALAYANQVFTLKDQSWMLNFGTDLNRHFKELHELLADIYDSLAAREMLIPRAGLYEQAASFILSTVYRFRSYYHRQRFKMSCLIVGKEYLKEKNHRDAYWEFYQANKDYRDIALKYLRLARDIETEFAPHANAYYLLEEGSLMQNPELIRKALEQFDLFWEKEGIAEALISLIPLLPEGSAERRKAINRLYEINSGGLIQYNFGLPFELNIQLSGIARKAGESIIHLLKKAGSEITQRQRNDNLELGFRYSLEITWDASDKPSCRLTDKEKKEVLLDESFTLPPGTLDQKAAALLRDLLLKHIYMVKR